MSVYLSLLLLVCLSVTPFVCLPVCNSVSRITYERVYGHAVAYSGRGAIMRPSHTLFASDVNKASTIKAKAKAMTSRPRLT